MDVVGLVVVEPKRDLGDVAHVLTAIAIDSEHEGDEPAEREHHLIVAQSHKSKNKGVLLSDFVQQNAFGVLVAELLVEQTRRYHLENYYVQEDE